VSDRFRSARWVTVEELDEGRWQVSVLDEADDELGTFGIGVEGTWDVDVEPHVGFLLGQLGLALFGSRPWRLDEVGAHRAQVLPT
jgi:hypothetical protein